MKQRTQPPEVADIIRQWMPRVEENDLKEATVNLRRYLTVVYRVTLRLEAERKPTAERDKLEPPDIVNAPNSNVV